MTARLTGLHPAGRYKRAAYDWYCEEPWVVEALFDAIPMAGIVGDPCCGRGNIPEVARARGHEIIATDIVDRGYDRMTAVADFLEDRSEFACCHNIVMNPPYSYRPKIAESFVRRALEMRPEVLAVVMPIRWLTGQARFELFSVFPPSRILYFSERPTMPPGHMIAELGNRAFRGGTIDYCWIVWNAAATATEVTFIPPRRKPRRAKGPRLADILP